MTIQSIIKQINQEKEIEYEEIIDHSWTKAQVDLLDKGDEADDQMEDLL